MKHRAADAVRFQNRIGTSGVERSDLAVSRNRVKPSELFLGSGAGQAEPQVAGRTTPLRRGRELAAGL